MQSKAKLLTTTFIVLMVWMLIVMGGALLQVGKGSLNDLATKQIVVSLVIAPIFLFSIIYFLKWNLAELGLKRAEHWRVLWFPGLFVVTFFAIAIVMGLPPLPLIGIALLNTLCVGVSEELMFRGIVFRGVSAQFKLWPAIWITSLLFGGVHALNGFVTGEFQAAFAQAGAATMSGFWMHAIRLRANSLYPAMLIHWLWDFSLFVLVSATASVEHIEQSAEDLNLMQQLVLPLLFPLPLFLYGLWLLRGTGRHPKENVLV